MFEYEGTVTVYLDGEAVGRLTKERGATVWYPDEDLTNLVDTPPRSGATVADFTLEKTLENVKKMLNRLGTPIRDDI